MYSPGSPALRSPHPPMAEAATGEFAVHLVQQALGEQALESATALQLSGHRQQLTSLGGALAACHALTDVDLSRNGLATLHGLQSLQQLRRLNLYYNAIGEVAELSRLRHHPELAVLDLRLNPVRPPRLRACAPLPPPPRAPPAARSPSRPLLPRPAAASASASAAEPRCRNAVTGHARRPAVPARRARSRADHPRSRRARHHRCGEGARRAGGRGTARRLRRLR